MSSIGSSNSESAEMDDRESNKTQTVHVEVKGLNPHMRKKVVVSSLPRKFTYYFLIVGRTPVAWTYTTTYRYPRGNLFQ